MGDGIQVDAVRNFAADRIERENPDGTKSVEITNGFSRVMLDEQGIAYMSKPRIAELKKSPNHYKWRYIQGNEPSDTPAKKYGRLVDWALLAPQEFLRRYVITKTFKGKGAKAAKKEWQKSLPADAIVLSQADAEDVAAQIEALYAHPRAVKLLSNGTPQVHTYFHDPEFKVVKILPDGTEVLEPVFWYGVMDFYRSGNFIVEVKTAASAQWWNFNRDAYKFDYHIQMFLYRRAVMAITGQKPDLAMIVLEKGAPYNVEIFEIPERWFEHANYEVTLALNSFNECTRTGYWHGYSKDPIRLPFPAYTKSRFDDEDGE
jgi:hypothetical protein